MPTEEPCHECAACQGILNGSISDVIEIDAASNTSVDDIREIRDKVKYAPSSVPYKVYIIDEVHMISTSAFNALLKTLEEPPKHVVFILATTEPHKIPLTIISRCQRFDFRSIGTQAMIERMKPILSQEKISVTEAALETIALTAEGGMRDAWSILDQAISYSDGTVDVDDVLAVTGGVSQHVLTDFVASMYDQQVEQSLQLLDTLIQQGKDPGRLVFDLIYFLRDILLYKSSPELESHLERAIVDERFKQLTEQVTNDWVQDAMMHLNTTQQEMKWSNHSKVFIEIAIVTIATNQQSNRDQANQTISTVDEQKMMDLTSRINQLEQTIKNMQSQTTEQPVAPRRKQQMRKSSKPTYQVPMEQIKNVLDVAEKSALQQIVSSWADFLNQIKSISAPAHATIQNSKPVAASHDTVIVAFKYEIQCSVFLEHRETVENILSQVHGKPFTIIPIPEENWVEVRKEYVSQREKTNVSRKADDPLIEKARELVGDDLLEIYDE